MDKLCACHDDRECANIMVIMRAGETLGGKYVLETLLGKGGMGVVWSAYELQTQQRFAVKLIIPQNEDALTDELRKRLLREAGACAKLQHPNIIQVYDVDETDEGDAYMVLELLEGQALGDVLKQKRRLEPKLAARIAADIASGLAEAHAAKVVHRDLKPANIFLHREPGMGDDEFVTKVLDFGVCIDRESVDALKTKTNIIVGSPAYMSPEQVARRDIDGRTDIWALGLMLYEMVTGMRVFHGNVHNVMAQIVTQPVPAPSSKVRGVPADLDAVVARCTQINREHRYADAGELARDLYAISGARPSVRQPSTSRPSFSKQNGLPGMAAMFDQEIQATPAVPKPGSARTFNPNGATLPLITPGRRAEVERLPPVIDEDDDMAATLPLQGKMLSAMRPKPVDEAPIAALGTQLFKLRPDEVAPSPEPAWKQEMEQALEVHRQSSASLPVFVLDAPEEVAGATHMLSSEINGVRPNVPMPSDASGTTSRAISMSQEIRLSSRSAPDPAGVTGTRRRRTRTVMFVAAGFLAASFTLMVGVVVYQEFLVPKPEAVSKPVEAAVRIYRCRR
jgi:serine/threonine protein kinase